MERGITQLASASSGKCRMYHPSCVVECRSMPEPRPRRTRTRLETSVFLGFATGLSYTLLDSYLDHTFGVQVSPPARPIEVLHAIIDFVLPPITGGLLGVAVHYVRLRARMAELEKQRADGLVGDLHKIERDQAVWVISASLLHELKNPLHALGLLLDEALELPDTERKHQQELLMRGRAQLDRIATELASLRALPSSTRPDLPIQELPALVKTATDAARRDSPFVALECRGEVRHLKVRANPAYVRIILENLLENAVEALREHQPGTTPGIAVRIATEGNHGIVEVSDNGPGIDAETREHIFEPLNSNKPSGMGLGLAIARTLARSMGGELMLVEGPRGATFRLLLERQGQTS